MHRIAVAGHLCLDFTPALGASADVAPGRLFEVGPLAISLGGSVANTGRTLAALGAKVVPFASIGDDDLGAVLVRMLSEQGFEAGSVERVPGASTSYSVVIERPGVDRTFWHHPGANAGFDGSGIELDGIEIFHLGYPPLLPGLVANGGQPLRALLARARAAGAVTSVDLAVVDPTSPVGAADWDVILSNIAAETDILSPSLDDLTSALRIEEGFSVELVDRLACRLIDGGVAVVAISAGEQGLFVRTAGEARLREAGRPLAAVASSWADCSLDTPPLPVPDAVTTTGAGDAASAGLLCALADGTSIKDAAALAASCSAAVMNGTTPIPALPNQ